MNSGTKLAALNKFRSSGSVLIRQPVTKVLVVYDVQVKTPEVSHVPLIINYGALPNLGRKSVRMLTNIIRFAQGRRRICTPVSWLVY
jgi:hypothetical protein